MWFTVEEGFPVILSYLKIILQCFHCYNFYSTGIYKWFHGTGEKTQSQINVRTQCKKNATFIIYYTTNQDQELDCLIIDYLFASWSGIGLALPPTIYKSKFQMDRSAKFIKKTQLSEIFKNYRKLCLILKWERTT